MPNKPGSGRTCETNTATTCTASREIGRFLEELDESLQEIESGYLNSELEYEDVVHRMNAVLRRARYFQVALDEDHALDVNGRVLRRR